MKRIQRDGLNPIAIKCTFEISEILKSKIEEQFVNGDEFDGGTQVSIDKMNSYNFNLQKGGRLFAD